MCTVANLSGLRDACVLITWGPAERRLLARVVCRWVRGTGAVKASRRRGGGTAGTV